MSATYHRNIIISSYETLKNSNHFQEDWWKWKQ